MSVCVCVLTRVAQIIFPPETFSTGLSDIPPDTPNILPWQSPAHFPPKLYPSSWALQLCSFRLLSLPKFTSKKVYFFHGIFNELLVQTHTTAKPITKKYVV